MIKGSTWKYSLRPEQTPAIHRSWPRCKRGRVVSLTAALSRFAITVCRFPPLQGRASYADVRTTRSSSKPGNILLVNQNIIRDGEPQVTVIVPVMYVWI